METTGIEGIDGVKTLPVRHEHGRPRGGGRVLPEQEDSADILPAYGLSEDDEEDAVGELEHPTL